MSKTPADAGHGRNSVAGQDLVNFLERIERVREQKSQLAEDEKVIFAEIKAAGYSKKRVRDVLKIREMNPHEFTDNLAELNMYLEAIGMPHEAPLFERVGLLSVDPAVKDQIVAALKQLVPVDGEIIVKAGGVPLRLYRDKKGRAHAEDYVETPAPQPPQDRQAKPKPPPEDVPDVDEAGAFELGVEAFYNGKPIIKNPFPWDDKRRPKWDAGWRKAAGNDGMGPNEDD
jgi:uncharacterized protein (UPF0335 family)